MRAESSHRGTLCLLKPHREIPLTFRRVSKGSRMVRGGALGTALVLGCPLNSSTSAVWRVARRCVWGRPRRPPQSSHIARPGQSPKPIGAASACHRPSPAARTRLPCHSQSSSGSPRPAGLRTTSDLSDSKIPKPARSPIRRASPVRLWDAV